MTTVIDALLVTLGLDASLFIKKQREAADLFKKVSESHVKQSKEMEAGFKGVAVSLGSVAVGLAAFFAALAVKKAKDFIVPFTETELKLGQTAKSIGMGANQLGAWELMLKRGGGKSGEAASSLQSLSDSFQELKIHGESATTEPFLQAQRFGGVKFDPFAPSEEKMRVLAVNIKNIAKTSPELAHAIGMGATHSEAMTQAFMASGDELEKIIAENEKLVGFSEADIEAAKKRTKVWADLQAAVDRLGEKIATRLTRWLIKLDEIFIRLAQQATEFFKNFKGLSAEWIPSMSDAVHFVVSVFSGSADDIRKAWSQMWTDMSAKMNEWIEAIKHAGPYLLSALQAAFGTVFDAIKGRVNAWFEAVGLAAPFSTGGGAGGVNETAGKASPTTEEQKRLGLRFMDELIKLGWTPEAAAIAAGNAQQESSFNLNAVGDPSVPGGSHDLMQWNRERWLGFQSFRASHPELQDMALKAPYVDYQASRRSDITKAWKGVKDLRAAGAISHAYEGYGDSSTGTRIGNSQEWLRRYREQHPGPQSSLGRPGLDHLAALSAPGVSANYNDAMASNSSTDVDTHIGEVNLHGDSQSGTGAVTRNADQNLSRLT